MALLEARADHESRRTWHWSSPKQSLPNSKSSSAGAMNSRAAAGLTGHDDDDQSPERVDPSGRSGSGTGVLHRSARLRAAHRHRGLARRQARGSGPPGSSVGLVLLPPDSEIPMAVRLGTTSAEAAHARLRQAGAKLHNDEVIHLDGSPPMFFFADPDGNGLVYLEEEPPSATDN